MTQAPSGTRRCYLHVGLPKTGTSFLQSVFRQSEGALAAQGLDLLPRTWLGRRYLTVALRGRLDPDTDPPAAFKVLDKLAKEAANAQGDRALISREVLGALTPDQIPPLLEALPGYEVHLIVTVRDLARTLPSGWQQETQTTSTTSLGEFVAEFSDRSEAALNKHRRRVLQSVLDSWEHHVPASRIHVVTVPPSSAGPRALLERYCTVLSVDPATIDTGTPRENTALGMTQAELLRRVNIAIAGRLSHPRGDYEQQVKLYLAKQLLRPQGGRPPRLPESARGWVTDASEAVIERLAQGGYDVVGDLDDLRPDPAYFAVPGDEGTSEAELLDAAVAAIADLLVDRAAGPTEGDPR